MLIKRLFIILLFVATAASAKPVLNIQHWQTDNGTRVYFVHATELPMVDIAIAFSAGSAYDGSEYGVAQLTNSMLDQGTKTLSADDIAKQFADVGANFSTSTGRDMALLSLRSLSAPKYLDPALKTFTNVLTSADFPSRAFKRLQNITLLSIKQEEQFPFTVARKAFYRSIYSSEPYAHPVGGTEQTVSKLNANDLQTFYNNYYVAKNAVLAIVGDVTEAQAKKMANEITNKLPAGKAVNKLTLAKQLKKSLQDHVDFPAAQTSIIIGQIGINRTNPDRFALYVGNYILGGGMTSRLYDQVREQRGLAYSVSSNFKLLNYRGPFSIVLQTRNDEAKKALDVAKDTLNNFVKNGPSKAELADAKQHIIGAFPLGIASNSAILSNVINIGFYNLPLNYLDTYRDKIHAVSRKDIKTAFKKYLQPNNMATITVGGNAS